MNMTSLDEYVHGVSFPDLVDVVDCKGNRLERNGNEFGLQGCELIALGLKKEDMLEIHDEASKIELATTGFEKTQQFSILSPEPRFDGVTFGGVEDILTLAETDRPAYVMAQNGWMSNRDDCSVYAGDVFRVGTRISKTSTGELCVAWERCYFTTSDAPMQWSVLRNAESRPTQLGFSARCGFMASAEHTSYTVLALEELVRNKKLRFPVRLQEIHTNQGSTVSGKKYCLKGTKTVEWLLALCHEPNTSHGYTPVRIQMSTSLSRGIKVCRPRQSDPSKLHRSLQTYILQSADLKSVEEIRVCAETTVRLSLPPPSPVPSRGQSPILWEEYEQLHTTRANNHPSHIDHGRRSLPARPNAMALRRKSLPGPQQSTTESDPYLVLRPRTDGRLKADPTLGVSTSPQRNLTRGSQQLPVPASAATEYLSQNPPKLPPRSPTLSKSRKAGAPSSPWG
eukprot:scpid67717/ scgid29758/ 